jgi:hypothetical protein
LDSSLWRDLHPLQYLVKVSTHNNMHIYANI